MNNFKYNSGSYLGDARSNCSLSDAQFAVFAAIRKSQERVEKQNIEIAKFIEQLDKDFEKSIQKVGIIRYNAYKDTGSDLSFTLALLDENNNGVVLNGIYSREMSNIYAKPIENGKSTYTLSDEEQKAIERAINSTKSGR